MKRLLCLVSLWMLCFVTAVGAAAAEYLVPVGALVGLQLRDNQVTVAAYDDVLGAKARDCGLKIGDTIVKVNDTAITSADDVRTALDAAQGPVQLTVRRGSRSVSLTVTPELTGEGPRLGVYLRQGIAGIGTVTWFDPASGRFGALGHGVNDASGCLLHMADGTAYTAEILSVVRGKSGHPGQLRGSADTPWGILTANTPQGIFGQTSQGWTGAPLPVAQAEQLHTGPATILSTVSGAEPKEYAVEIVKLYPASRSDGRNLLLRVTDPALLEATGGIVQGMSGSPIVQDGCLVGAVTHVCVTSMMPTILVSLDINQFRSHQTCLFGILFSSAPL